MNTTTRRLYAVAVIIVATYGISRLVQAQTEPPEVDMPPWTFREFPLQLGNWHGEKTQLNPEIAMATGAEVIVDRAYRDPAGHTISMHTAMFKNPASGIGHTPSVCYTSSGWRMLNQSFENVQVSNDVAVVVKLTTWERESDTVLVACWFQLGDHVLYERFDMAHIRWALRGQPKWPVLTKVMLQTSVTESDDARTNLMAFTEQVVKWLNQPEHRKYLDRWPGA